MLSLFVPQSCGDHVCTISENYEKEDLYHVIAIYTNAFSMLVFFICYIIELIREEWCVKYLDIDNNYPDNYLKKIIVQEKGLDTYMDKIKKIYYNVLLATTSVYGLNLFMTIKMIKDNYHSSSTISCFA